MDELVKAAADQALGRSVDVRRFLATLILETRVVRVRKYHGEERQRVMSFCDRLLDELRGPGWDGALHASHEKMLTDLQRLDGNESRSSHLPRGAMTLESTLGWLRPIGLDPPPAWTWVQEILLVVTGARHADQLIFRHVADAMHRRFPRAPLTVMTARPEFWDGVAGVDRLIAFAAGEELEPFLMARAAIRERPGLLPVFLDEWPRAVYRNLELVQGFPVFVTINLISCEARVVDQRARTQARLNAPSWRTNVHASVHELLQRIDLGASQLDVGLDGDAQLVERVLVDTHPGDKGGQLDVSWTAALLDALAQRASFEVAIGRGVSADDEAAAKALRARLAKPAAVPILSLAEALSFARPGTLILGTDGLLTQLGSVAPVFTATIKPLPDNFRQPPGPRHLGIIGTRAPSDVATLLARWFRAPEAGERAHAGPVVALADRLASLATTAELQPAEILAAVTEIARRLSDWATAEPALTRDFGDDLAVWSHLAMALGRGRSLLPDESLRDRLSLALVAWHATNFARHAKRMAARHSVGTP